MDGASYLQNLTAIAIVRGDGEKIQKICFLALFCDLDALFEVLEQLVFPNWRYAQFDSNRCNGLHMKTQHILGIWQMQSFHA